jgi:hypothetical protein
MSENYAGVFDELKQQNENVREGCVMDEYGGIVFSSSEWISAKEVAGVLDAWSNHGFRLEVAGMGFSILRSEPEALVSKNVASGSSILGSITKDKKYFIAQLGPMPAESIGRMLFDVARAADKME